MYHYRKQALIAIDFPGPDGFPFVDCQADGRGLAIHSKAVPA